MQEIEVKARVKDENRLLAALAGAGISLGRPSIQEDAVYIRGEEKAFLADPNRIVFRIRKTEGKTLLTQKRPSTGNDLASTEHETEIADGAAAEAMLRELGYYKNLEVRKSRREGHSGDVSVCLDEVDGLGLFIELERLVPDGQEAGMEEGLSEMLAGWGIGEEDRETQRYDTLVRLKNS